MPLYEYQCDACGHRFEAIQKLSDPPPGGCPACGGAVRKLQSAPAFQFKGTGWYVTDYARKDEAAKDQSGDGKPEAPARDAPAADKVSPDKAPAAAAAASDSGDKASSPTSSAAPTPSK